MKNPRVFDFSKRDLDPSWIFLASLVARFYGQKPDFSSQTSSHWKKLGMFQYADMSESILSLQGIGFGDYENSANLRAQDKLRNMILSLACRVAIFSLPLNIRKIVRKLAATTSREVNPDFIRLSKSAVKICTHIELFQVKRVMIIGDGYGTLACLLYEMVPELTIVQVNLGRCLVFDLAFTTKAYKFARHELIDSLLKIHAQAFNYLPAEDMDKVDVEIELFIAIESFQEMDIEIVNSYFEMMRKQKTGTHLYSANRLSKALPDGNVIRKEDYGWNLNDKTLSSRTPWWLNWGIRRRPPFVFRMDGIIEEAIIKLK
jgi:hypothetical protein